MRNAQVKKMALAGVLCAVAVVGSLLQFPVLGSQCAPVQHMVNVVCAVFLGPGWGVAVAFVASLLRNLFHLGSLMAFPGSMCGALLCGLVYWKMKNLPAVAKELMGLTPETYTAFVVPFLISTAAGSILAGALLTALKKSGALHSMQTALSH